MATTSIINFWGTAWVEGMKEYPNSFISFCHTDDTLMIATCDDDSNSLDFNRVSINMKFTAKEAEKMIEYCKQFL